MSNRTIIALVVVLIVLVGAYFLFARHAAAPGQTTTAPADTSTTSVSTTASASVAAPVVITYTDAGFSPKSISIKTGQAVQFVNSSSHGMWVASDVHPTHTNYDGTSLQQHCTAGADTNGGFDECKPINAGSTYSFTFAKAGTFNYHNHVHASDLGTVVVSQ